MANYNAAQMASFIKELLNGGTCKQIAEKTGLGHSTVMRYMRSFRAQNVVVVDRYTRTRDLKAVKVWVLRTDPYQKDAVKPPPMTHAERTKRYRMKKQATAMKKMARQLAYRRAA